MITPRSTAPVDPDQISKLVRMLSSDRPGEAGAAAAALHRTLHASGLDLHWAADVIQSALSKQALHPSTLPVSTMTAARREPRGKPLRVGDRIACCEHQGVFAPCGWCRSSRFRVAAGVGPHAAQLICENCGRKGRWLSRSHVGL
jgi:hypothetical protein